MVARRLSFIPLAFGLVAAGVAWADQPAGQKQTKTQATTNSPGQASAWLDAQLQAIGKTRELLDAKYHNRRQEHRRRVVATYKLLRAGSAPAWRTSEQRVLRTAKAEAARRALARDLAELDLLRDEMTAVHAARERIEAEKARAARLSPPQPRSLRCPVAWSEVIEPFGLYRDPISQAQLSRRGVWLSSRPGRNVRAMAPGSVRYAGDIRRLGRVVIVDHGDYTAVFGGLSKPNVARGQAVKTGDILGESAADRVYLEIRLDVGPGGFPIDPEPLIKWK